MTMKQEIETWVTALQLYDNNEFEGSIRAFEPIADTSKILFNCGVIRATLGEHEAAVDFYRRATALDQYLAIAYFQSGVSHFLIGEFEEALRNFNDTLLYLRGNTHIDYEQLGLKFKLYSCEALFNRGLSYIYLQATGPGMTDLQYASKEKAIPEHDVIDEAIAEKAEGYTVFSIPVGIVFRPSDAKIKNVRARNYLGKPTLIATDRAREHAALPSHAQLSTAVWAKDDRPAGQISYAATNLVRADLPTRTRQQSEPPLSRNVYPPTPPPDAEKPQYRLATIGEQQQSVPQHKAVPQGKSSQAHRNDPSPPRPRSRSTSRRPEPLNLGVAAFEKPTGDIINRRAPARSASERPMDRRRRLGSEGDLRDTQDSRYNVHRTKHSREHLFGALDNQLPDPERLPKVERGSQRHPAQLRVGNVSRSRGIEEETEDDFMDQGFRERVPKPGSRTAIESAHDLHAPRSSASTYSSNSNTHRSTISRSGGVRRIRAKMHFDEDTRYILTTPDVRFADFVELVINKFSLIGERPSVKLKMKDDEGDMITMSDQADLDMFIGMSRDHAIRDGLDMGKLEVWIQLG